MNESQANVVADALGGNAWNSGGEIWVVHFERSDGRFIVISDDIICEYETKETFEENNPLHSILLH